MQVKFYFPLKLKRRAIMMIARLYFYINYLINLHVLHKLQTNPVTSTHLYTQDAFQTVLLHMGTVVRFLRWLHEPG